MILPLLAGCITQDAFGIVFAPRQQILVSDDQWVVVVDYDLEQLARALRNINKMISTLQEHSTFYHDQIAAGKDEGVENLIKNSLEIAQVKIGHLAFQISDLEFMLPSHRPSRGLADGLGMALHLLAGTATDKDIDTLDNKLKSLLHSQVNIRHVLDSQLTYFNRTSDTFVRHEELFKQLSNGLESVSKAIKLSQNISAAVPSDFII